MTRHDMTLLHILTYGSCAHGKGKRTEEKKKQSCTPSCCQRSLTPIEAHALITDTLHFLRFKSMTRHDMTLLHILTYGSCAHGKGKRTEEKKKQSCTPSCCQRSLTPIEAHALPIQHLLLKPMLSHPHAGLNLACSVASLSHPSVATCQIIMHYSMKALQTAS